MLDSGNLVLYDKNNQKVWQSFDTPTNTLLVGQKYLASANITMFAWQKNGNWMPSRYSLAFRQFYISTSWESPYQTWSSSVGPSYWNYTIPLLSIVLTVDAKLLGASNDSTSSTNSSLGVASNYAGGNTRLLRATFDDDGNWRMYSWLLGSSKEWVVEWEAITNICHIFYICGPFSICDDAQCMCPPGFQYVDETNPFQGCARMNPIPLCNNSNAYGNVIMNPVDSIDFPDAGDYVTFFNQPISACTQTCLSTCSCLGFSLSPQNANGTYTCWFKKDVLLNGQINNNNNNDNRVFYMRIAEATQRGDGLSPSQKLLIVSTTLSLNTIFLGVFSCTLGGILACQKLKHLRVRRLEAKWQIARGHLIRFSYKDIQVATSNFAHEIGKGGYGSVFKGNIGGLATVAVKRLDNLTPEQEKGFVNEVDIIGKIHHVNLVHLLGYCASGHHRLLVYEYLKNSSLDKLLFHHTKYPIPPLEWRTRFKIALETARGLTYLHEEVREQRIIHCDVKPENILLDFMLSAKVADFGISRIMNREQTCTTTTKVRGTFGYLAPEWTSNHVPITTKTDVYSFGMVLLELVSGRRNVKCSTHCMDQLEEDWYFPLWAYPKVETEAFLEVVDPLLDGLVDAKEVKRALIVAFWCINDKPDVRPSMSKVVQLLEGHIALELPVPRPNFLMDEILVDPGHEGKGYSISMSPTSSWYEQFTDSKMDQFNPHVHTI